MPINTGSQKKQAKQYRIVLLALPDFAPAASIWAVVAKQQDKTLFTLLHDYPGLKPAAGWRVQCGTLFYDIQSVNGRAILCGAEAKS